MNVACTACPAKYAVPDDRVRGKRVRITCKHCGTFIVVDGTQLGEGGSQATALPQSSAANAAREKRKTMLGIGASPNASAAASLGVAVQSSPRASRIPAADVPSHHAWLVALPDGRREPASLARIVDLFVAGSIGTSTYIWREGMPDWKKPFEIVEIAAALRARGIAADGIKSATLPPPDPEEATRVSFSANEESHGQAPAPAKPSSASRPPASTSSFDDESVTVALTGPPSNPFGQSRPLTPPNTGRRSPRATLPPLPPAAGLPRSSAEPPAPRVRSNTIPPLGSSRPAPRSATPNPSAPPAFAAPTPPPPPPPVVPSVAPPAVAVAQAPSASFPPAVGVTYSAPSSAPPPYAHPSSVPPAVAASARPPVYAAPAQFPVVEGVPRSGPPVSLQLDDNPFQRRGKAATTIAALLLVAGFGVAGYLYFGQRAAPPPPPPPVAATPPPPPPAPVPAPAPTPSEAPEPEATATTASSVASVEKAPSAPKPSAPARARHEESAPRPSPRRTASADSTESESDSSSSASSTAASPPTPAPSEPSSAEPTTPEAAMAERLARADDSAAPKSNSNEPEFNRDAAAASLGEAASRADSCRTMGGPSGTGQATVTFAPSGRVSSASVGGEFSGTAVGACIARLFKAVTVPAFSGDSVTVSKRFTLE